MELSLSREMEEFINRKIASGQYDSAGEVVHDALRLMEERERNRETELEQLRQELAVGIEQLDRGERIPADAVFAELRAKAEQLRRDQT